MPIKSLSVWKQLSMLITAAQPDGTHTLCGISHLCPSRLRQPYCHHGDGLAVLTAVNKPEQTIRVTTGSMEAHDCARVMQLSECIHGSLMDTVTTEQITIPGELSKEEYTQASSEESKEVTTPQDDQNEVSKLRIGRDADLYPEEHKEQSKDTRFLQEDATSATEGDSKTLKEVEEYNEKAVTPKESNSRRVGISIVSKGKDSTISLEEEDFNMAYHKEKLSVGPRPDNKVKVDEDFKELPNPHGPYQEYHMSTAQHVEPCEGQVSLKELEGTFESKGSCKAASDQDKMDIGSKIICQRKVAESSFSLKDAIAQNIQQGELLLYRLHLVKQNQELQQVSDGPLASHTAAMVMTNDTMENVTMMPHTEGEDDGGKETDLSLREETIETKESEVQRFQTSSAETGEHKEAKMEKKNTRPIEETPIQREIREGLEREKTLRQSRGLYDSGEKSQELVEIAVKRSLETPEQIANFGFDAEKRLAKRKMLQDINQEAMKEQVLKKLDCVYRGKLTLIWPPPSSKVKKESGPPNPVGQRPTLQHRWENGTTSSSYNERD
ncbi:hypothetical protein AOLI_G00166770 [Acnodon oligacanthus]